MTRRFLVTGATGFVGRQVLSALARRDAHVRLVVRDGKQGRFETLDRTEIVATSDLFAENAEWFSAACRDIDTVIHVAWYAEPGEYLRSPRNIDCLAGTLQLAKGAAQAGVRRFVGIGTCFEYDLEPGRLGIDTPLRPLTPYAGAKTAAYTMLSQWLLVPYLRSSLSSGRPAALTSGDQIRDFLDVAQAGRMIVDCALSETKGAVNICSGVGITVRKMAEQIADQYGRRDLLEFGARQENVTDPPCIVGIPAPTWAQPV
jgi:nucleoside-diphosphate-sugar epimerase